ncbi:UU173 family protein [Mycoplasmopsis anatis]|uniref:UU173 family protein n=1 Tax=Mycoplasmopsis anatis TaxID=171279 RepID=UPI001C4ECFB5|nr:DUF2779 domain-containing protein [Mycoplasmopsis anatis]MBW0596667.1 DUF2779 domain-containing protein [Mycoplasmopsis anatis]
MNKEIIKIGFNHFRIYNSGLKNLSWFTNFEEKSIELYKEIWDKSADSEDLLNFITSDEEGDEDYSNELHENLNFDDDDTDQIEIKIENKNFEKYVNEALEFYLTKNNITDKNQIGFVSSKLSIKDKIKQTIDFLNDPKIKVISKPVLGYVEDKINKEFLINSSVFAYDKDQKKIIYLKYSSCPTQEYYLKGMFDYSIYKKLNVDVEDFSIICIDGIKGGNRFIIKNKINFIETKGVWQGKNKPSLNNGDLNKFNIKINGLLYEKASLFGANFDLPLSYWVKRNLFPNVSVLKINGDLESGYSIKYENIINNATNIIDEPFNTIVNNIIESNKYIDDYKLIANYLTNELLNISLDELKNKIETERLENLNFYNKINALKWLKKEEINSLCLILMGKLHHQNGFKLYGIKNKFNLFAVKKIDDRFAKLPYIVCTEALNIIKKIHIKDSVTVWYDYEGFSSVFPIINGMGPNRQIINQVSIIKTFNGKKIWNTNLVIDTKKIKLIDLIELIENIYDINASAYVVFNKTYENYRNSEISDLVYQTIKKVEKYEQLCESEDPRRHEFYEVNNLKDDIEFVEEFIKKGYVDEQNNPDHYKFDKLIQHINNNTVDLADAFKYYSLQNEAIQKTKYYKFTVKDKLIHKDKLSKSYNFEDMKEKIWLLGKDEDKTTDFEPCYAKLAFTFLNDLKNKYSIKKIENFITSNDLKLKTRIKPYKDLEIKNGTMAMAEAIKRHAGITGEFSWEKITESLKEYCENDVIAMIMVYEFIMEIFRKITNNIDDFEYKLNINDVKKDSKYVIDDNLNIDFLVN